ncbi:MAG: hypothetical protein ACI9KF_001899, partial [Arenicella sp.]
YTSFLESYNIALKKIKVLKSSEYIAFHFPPN